MGRFATVLLRCERVRTIFVRRYENRLKRGSAERRIRAGVPAALPIHTSSRVINIMSEWSVTLVAVLSAAAATPLAVLALEVVSRRRHHRRYYPRPSLAGKQQQQQQPSMHRGARDQMVGTELAEARHEVAAARPAPGRATGGGSRGLMMPVTTIAAPPTGQSAGAVPSPMVSPPPPPYGQIAAAALPIAPATPMSQRSDHYLYPRPGSARLKVTQDAQRSILVGSGSGIVSSRI